MAQIARCLSGVISLVPVVTKEKGHKDVSCGTTTGMNSGSSADAMRPVTMLRKRLGSYVAGSVQKGAGYGQERGGRGR
jgi:hypothetical protein